MSNIPSVPVAHCADFRHLPLEVMETKIARFEERVNAAQQANPPTKEWVKRAIQRQGAPRCPVRIKRVSYDLILRYGDDLADLFVEFPDDVLFLAPYDMSIGYQPPERIDRINQLDVLMRSAQWIDEWGTCWGHAFGGVGATPLDHPLKDWTQLDDYLSSRVPDPLVADRLDASRVLLEVHGKAKYCVGIINGALFERLFSLRGMQNTFADFCTNEPQIRRLLDALTEYLVALTRFWGKLGADAVMYTDDWGTQRALMISLPMWRNYFKAHYQNVFDVAHRAGMDVIFHSCGNVTAIVPELIDLGVDVLDPVQPSVMDVNEVARRFGGLLSFSGAIDIQHMMVSGTPRQIKDAVRQLVDMLGRPFGNGLIVSPANTLTSPIPGSGVGTSSSTS